MNCPVCTDSTLVMADRAGIEIDYCPTCRGVWLDRGELDKIIERSASAMNVATAGPSSPPAVATKRYDDTPPHGYKKKKSSLLGEIFDF